MTHSIQILMVALTFSSAVFGQETFTLTSNSLGGQATTREGRV